MLLRLRDADRARYVRIVRAIKPGRRRSSGIFVLVPERAVNGTGVLLRWQQEGSDTVLPADALSDGTLRFICLTVLLGQLDRPGLIVLDEPELGLHPFAITQLAEALRTASRESQVLLATQSVTLMNQFELGDLSSWTPRWCLRLRTAGPGPPRGVARGLLARRAVGEEHARRAPPPEHG